MNVPAFQNSPVNLSDASGELKRLAAIAQRKWHDLGWTNVKFWVETKTVKLPARIASGTSVSGEPFYEELEARTKTEPVICSNLVNGLPPEATLKLAA